jgi:uncharacterized protein YbbK (DUF523 family)
MTKFMGGHNIHHIQICERCCLAQEISYCPIFSMGVTLTRPNMSVEVGGACEFGRTEVAELRLR